MSEYTPITGELRGAMRQWGWDAEQTLAISGSDFIQLCDAIDAIHAQLERENAALKSSVAHAYASGYEHAEMDRDEWIELPKDVDGKPIRIGDVMEWFDGETFEVVGIGDGVLFYVKDGHEQADWTGASTKRHHVSDTWERIIEDARTCTGSAGNYTSVPSMRWTNEVDALVARCKKLAGDAE